MKVHQEVKQDLLPLQEWDLTHTLCHPYSVDFDAYYMSINPQLFNSIFMVDIRIHMQ